MSDAPNTPTSSGDGSSGDSAPTWNASSDAPSPLGAYGDTGSTANAGDSQVTDFSNPYAQGSIGSTTSYGEQTSYGHVGSYSDGSAYGQTSAGAASPYGDDPAYGQTTASPGSPYGDTGSYGQTSAGAASPYAQGSVGAPSPYGQTSSTNPYMPDASQPIAPANPYAQPAPAPHGYGAPGPQGPGGYPQGGVPAYGAQPYVAQSYTPAGPNAGGSGLNVFGLISLIVGGLGVLLMIVGGAAIFFGLVGVVLGVLGLVLAKYKPKKGLAIAGTIVSSVAVIGGIISLVIFSTLFSGSGLSDYNSADYPVTVTMTVTTTGSSAVDIDYSVTNGKSDENGFEVSDALFSEPMPYETSLDMMINDSGSDYSSVSLTATTDNYDDTISCEISVNDKVVAKDTSTGYASCYVTGLYAYMDGSSGE